MDNTVALIARLRYAMNDFILKALDAHGIQGIVPSHGDILVSLFQQEALTMSELAAKIQRDPSTITTLVKKLCHFGYTELVKDPADKRVMKVTLTPLGKSLKADFQSISQEIYAKQYKDIGPEEIKVFRDVLQRIIRNFEVEP